VKRCPRIAAVLALAAGGFAPAVAGTVQLQVALEPQTGELRGTARFETGAGGREVGLHESLAIHGAALGTIALDPVRGPCAAGRCTWHLAVPASGELRIEYGGRLPALDADLDHRAVLHALPPMAGAEGSYLPARSGWYPAPGGAFPYRVELSLPGAQRGLVPGRLLDEQWPAAGGDRYRATFEFDQPAAGITLMTGPWVLRQHELARDDGPPIRLRAWFYPDIEHLAEGYLADSARYLERFAERIGPYPYEAFSVVAGPLPTGFGMPTLTYMGRTVLALPFIRATSLAHEVLHNWWGNGVRIDPRSGNWSEGLTTFMADHDLRAEESPAAARAMRLRWLRDFAALPAGAHEPLAAFRARTHGAGAAVGYGQAAMLFVMLEDLVGADAFARGIRAFWSEQRFRTASWDDLRRAFEHGAGRPLADFFAQWLHRPGAPRVHISATRTRACPPGVCVQLLVEQDAPPWTLRLPVEFVTAGASHRHWLDIAAPSERHEIVLGHRPDGVRLDPQARLWRAPAASEDPPTLRRLIVAARPRLAIVTADAGVRSAASAVAARLFEARAAAVNIAHAPAATDPLLLAGLHADVDAALARLGWPPRPPELAGRGSAQVWTLTGRQPGAAPVAVVSARDAAALRAIARPLPHYGARSFLAFDGARVIEQGEWPAHTPLLPVTAGPEPHPP